MLFGLATTAQLAGWQAAPAVNARRTGTASTNASLTWSAASDTTTSTTQYKFGTASARLASTSATISSDSTTIGGMGTSDFTIECFIYLESLSFHSNSCDAYSFDSTSGGFGFRLAQAYETNGLSSVDPKYINLFARAQADLDTFTLPTNWPTGQWNFLVIQRKSGSFAAWLNGTLLSKSNASSSYNFATGSASLRIGTADTSNGIGPNSGYTYVDEFCISNTYRYDDPTEDIPVPTAAFTVDSYTVQLLHMDGSNGGTTFTNATS